MENIAKKRLWAEIVDSRVHWISPPLTFAQRSSVFPVDVFLVDITDLSPTPKLKWIYDMQKHKFYPPSYDIEVIRQEKIEELRETCRSRIIGTFICDTLGSPHRYDTEIEDQLNLTNVIDICRSKGLPTYGYACWPIVEGVNQAKQDLPHTLQQLETVRIEGATYIQSLRSKLKAYKEIVAQLADVISIQQIHWDMELSQYKIDKGYLVKKIGDE